MMTFRFANVQIFCETKRGCDQLTRQLRQDGWPALSIHGDKSQQERDWVLAVRCRPFRPCSRPHLRWTCVCAVGDSCAPGEARKRCRRKHNAKQPDVLL